MKKMVCYFSLLEPISEDTESFWVIWKMVYPERRMLLSWRRFFVLGAINAFRKKGELNEIGRYRVTVSFEGKYVLYDLHRSL